MTDDPLDRYSADRAIPAARSGRERCLQCGDRHPGAITPSLEARFRAYRAAHPAHQFVIGDASGILAVIVPRPAGPELLAWAADLAGLLDMVGAPSAAEL